MHSEANSTVESTTTSHHPDNYDVMSCRIQSTDSDIYDGFDKHFDLPLFNDSYTWNLSLLYDAFPLEEPAEGRPAWFGVSVAIVSLFGIVCNGVNLAVLTRRRLVLR